jgi:hypothetical protein
MNRPLAVWVAGSAILMAACTGSPTPAPPAVASAPSSVHQPAPDPAPAVPQVRSGSGPGEIIVDYVQPYAEPVALPLGVPTAGSAAVQPDGAVVVVDGAGRLVGAVMAPAEQSAAHLLVEAGRVRVVLSADRSAYPLSVRLTTVHNLVTAQRWVVVDGRRTLEVTPAPWLRRWDGQVAARAAWLEVTSGRRDAESSGMWEQFRCHVQFAATKQVWHLEPWRPALGYAATVVAACNPGPVPDPDLPHYRSSTSPSKTQVMKPS